MDGSLPIKRKGLSWAISASTGDRREGGEDVGERFFRMGVFLEVGRQEVGRGAGTSHLWQIQASFLGSMEQPKDALVYLELWHQNWWHSSKKTYLGCCSATWHKGKVFPRLPTEVPVLLTCQFQCQIGLCCYQSCVLLVPWPIVSSPLDLLCLHTAPAPLFLKPYLRFGSITLSQRFLFSSTHSCPYCTCSPLQIGKVSGMESKWQDGGGRLLPSILVVHNSLLSYKLSSPL